MTPRMALKTIVGSSVGVAVIGLLGILVALLPPTFTVILIFLGIGCVVLILAISTKSEPRTSIEITRVLLVVWVSVGVIWPQYLAFSGLPGPKINPTRILLWALIALWLYSLASSLELRRWLFSRLKETGVFGMALSFFILWSIICSVFGNLPTFSLDYFSRTFGLPLTIFCIAITVIRDKKDAEALLLAVVVGAGISTMIGLVEAVAKKNIFYDYVPFLFPQRSVEDVTWTEGLLSDKSRDGNYRVKSTFIHPLLFGEFLALSLAASFYMAFAGATRARRVLGAFSVPIAIVGVYISHTRSNLLAIGVIALGIVALYGVRAIQQKRSFGAAISGIYVLVFIPIVSLALFVIAQEFASGRTSGEASSTLARVLMVKYGWILVQEHPLEGYGPGLGAITLGIMPGMSAITIDNYYLSLALETGIPGLVAFSIALFASVFNGIDVSGKTDRAEYLMVGALGIAMFGYGVVRVVLSLPDNLTIVFLYMAIIFSIRINSRNLSVPNIMQR